MGKGCWGCGDGRRARRYRLERGRVERACVRGTWRGFADGAGSARGHRLRLGSLGRKSHACRSACGVSRDTRPDTAVVRLGRCSGCVGAEAFWSPVG